MSQPKAKVGATPGKLALIGVLAVVMVIVIASNWPSAAAPPVDALAVAAAPAASTAADPAVEGAPGPTPASPFGEFAEDRHWPELPLIEVTTFDPFAVSPWAKPLESVEGGQAYNEEQISELLSAQNAIILVSGDKRIARIGDQEYQVGDVVGRFRISDISSKGVVLSEAE